VVTGRHTTMGSGFGAMHKFGADNLPARNKAHSARKQTPGTFCEHRRVI